MTTVLWRWWFKFKLTLHEMRCEAGQEYNIWDGEDQTIVIHQPCGQSWVSP